MFGGRAKEPIFETQEFAIFGGVLFGWSRQKYQYLEWSAQGGALDMVLSKSVSY